MALIPLLSNLWRDAALDLFLLSPGQGWAAIPTAAEFGASGRLPGRLQACLKDQLLQRARVEFAGAVTLDDAGTSYPLGQLAYEALALTSILSPDDVRLISKQPGVVGKEVRSEGNRWREVLEDLRVAGAPTPTSVGLEDACTLLDDHRRSPHFVAALLGVVVEAGLSTTLTSRACLVLNDGNRVLPTSRSGLAVLLPPNPDPLWRLLSIGAHIHPAFPSQERWALIREWLQERKWMRSSATGADALAVLAGVGRTGSLMKRPLTDGQIDGLRRALEAVPDTDRAALAAGIGQAIRVDAVTHDTSGIRSKTHIRPCDAYFVEREANSWFVAAGKTPGLVWIDRRYSDKIRADGREGLGAQRLFRLLGAEVAPRVKKHPANTKRFVHYPPGVSRSAPGSPARRSNQLQHHHATFTVEDWVAPDLDAVLKNIAQEKRAGQQHRRAGAVLATLSRAWERLSEHVSVEAAAENRGWVNRGSIDAWWISSAASIAWLPSEKGEARAPDQLRIESQATVALYGDNPDRYLSAALVAGPYRDVLARIGVAGDPTASELIEKLEEVRTATTGADPGTAEDLAAPLYQALAAQTRGGRLRGQSANSARSAFRRGDGLIATRSGWRRPSVVLAGPPIFGQMRDFVPSVSATDALWTLLEVRRPTPQDARNVLDELARKKVLSSDDRLIMLEALRLLVQSPHTELASLRKAKIWVGDRWERKRPIYATRNSLIARVLTNRVPIWRPGGSLTQLEPLVDAYELTRLDASHGQVFEAEVATYDADLTQIFATAVTNLRSDLALSDPTAEQSLRISWNSLAALRVKQTQHLRVHLVEPTHGLDEEVELDTWLDLTAGTFYCAEEGAIGSPSSGAYAIASVFDGDTRRIAHDWVAAWSAAREGHREEEITTAARLDAERKMERDERNEASLRNLAEQGKDRRSKSNAPSIGRPASPSATRPVGQPQPKMTRRLIEPDSLRLKNEDGEIIGSATSDGPGEPAGKRATAAGGKQPDPDASNPKRSFSGSGPGIKNYTDEERETVGLELVRRVLGGPESKIVDIRHQRNVGADAIDDLKNFFELKVYAGPIPEAISLTNAEYQRAQRTEKFFLVVVGNVEQGDKTPEILIFTDPLNHLNVLPQGSVNLGGIRAAKALRYTFES